MKLSQLSLADYNQLDSIPVINQDLSASGFTPTSNTYYRHTGATTNTFTQGVIYLYDGTEYKALDGSGGGSLSLIKHEIDFKKENFYEIFDLLVSGNIVSAYGLFKYVGDSRYKYAGIITANYPWIWMQATSLSNGGWEYFAIGISMSSTDGRYGVYPKTDTTVEEVQEAKLIYYTQG